MSTTTAQSRQALVTANDRRQARARLRTDVREGRVSLMDLLADPPPVMQRRIGQRHVVGWHGRAGR